METSTALTFLYLEKASAVLTTKINSRKVNAVSLVGEGNVFNKYE